VAGQSGVEWLAAVAQAQRAGVFRSSGVAIAAPAYAKDRVPH
jgi:hypothetical protein